MAIDSYEVTKVPDISLEPAQHGQIGQGHFGDFLIHIIFILLCIYDLFENFEVFSSIKILVVMWSLMVFTLENDTSAPPIGCKISPSTICRLQVFQT